MTVREKAPERRVPLRRIASLFRPYRRLVAGLLVLVVGQGALGVVAPFLLRAIIDRGLPHHDALLITWLALGMIGSSVAAGVLGGVRQPSVQCGRSAGHARPPSGRIRPPAADVAGVLHPYPDR
jgi:ABC-type bacteriocin/lantibiotic exporter with double-glycine peptidase domain